MTQSGTIGECWGGSNSAEPNYLLFSTIFSFNKGLLGEPLLAFNISFFIPMLIWVVVKNVRNKFEAKYIALLLVFSMLMILNTTRLSNTSTDFLANIIVFYLFAGVLLNKDIHSEKYLLYFSVPVLLLTFKISTAPLGLFCILILFFCYKKKEYKVFRFLLIWGILAVGLWLIRNIILTGYLVYPIYQIDLFSFDWKIPKEIAIMQSNYIKILPIKGWNVFFANPIGTFLTPHVFHFMFSGSLVVLVMALVSFLLAVARLILKKYHPTISELVFWASGLLILLLGFVSGFDLRFIFGVIFAFTMYGFIVLFSRSKKSSYIKFGSIWLTALLLAFLLWSGRKFVTKYQSIYRWESLKSDVRPASSVWLLPYPNYLFFDVAGGHSPEKSILTEVELDGQSIYEGSCELSTFRFPVMIVYTQSSGRFVDYNCVRLRGDSFQDGFRMDKKSFEAAVKSKYGTPQNNPWLKK